ncbi:MAG: MBL fold metallo-hydrolase [Chlamydiales bacterium]|nr:MBL fold metallo-hydrolase [Chlamydiales bacterium]
MKGFCPLASGSKGNCIYVGTENTKILIDAGISRKALLLRLAEINVALEDIDAILITHEHTDHIQGLNTLGLKMGIPILANSETAKGIVGYFNDCPKFKIFATGETFEFGDMEIHPFSIQHDTLDPVAFTIKTCGLKLGFCADLGFATTLVENHLKGCDYLYLEANHDPALVQASPRPMVYKQRVLGRSGHLSNDSCADLLEKVCHDKLKHVHLAHLSSECNKPELALSVIGEKLSRLGATTRYSVAPQTCNASSILF